MATRPLASAALHSKTPRALSSGSHYSPPPLVRRLQTLTRTLASSSSSPQAMASAPAPKKVLVPVANGTEPMEAVITIDVLRRAGADVAVASVEPGSATVAAAWGVKLAADVLLTDIADAEFDLISLPILVPIANGTEEMEATMIIDILRRAKANVVVASLEDKLEVVASRKVKMVADVLLDDALKQQYDLILLPGGLAGAEAYAKSDKLMDLIKKQAEADKLYGAICASPAIALEPHGLLKGKKATSYPAMWNKLADQSECKNRVVVDGNLITSQGSGTSMEFSLAIVDKLFGRGRALELMKTMVFI